MAEEEYTEEYYNDEDIAQLEEDEQKRQEAEDEFIDEFYTTKMELEEELEGTNIGTLLRLITTCILFDFATNKGYIKDLDSL